MGQSGNKDGTVLEKVPGGTIKRDARTGKFREVRSESGVFRGSAKTHDVLRDVSARREAALKRLADR